jgi:hypothetical protein
MAASVQALLDIIEGAAPALYRAFSCLAPLFGTEETKAIMRIYGRLEETNFSHQVLELVPEKLAVLKVTGIKWNDLGEPKRVMASLAMAGLRPHWLDTPQPQFA